MCIVDLFIFVLYIGNTKLPWRRPNECSNQTARQTIVTTFSIRFTVGSMGIRALTAQSITPINIIVARIVNIQILVLVVYLGPTLLYFPVLYLGWFSPTAHLL